MKRHRVGIILNDLVCSRHIHDTVRSLKSENDIELVLILEESAERKSGHLSKIGKQHWRGGALDLLNSSTFAALQIAERRLIWFLNSAAREHFEQIRIEPGSFTTCSKVKPSMPECGAASCCRDEDVESLALLDLDIIVNGIENAGHCRRFLNSSRLGVVSLQFGDNHYSGARPSAFWEVYERAPSTGYVIYIFNENDHGGKVLCRGEIATELTYTENLVHLYEESGPFLAFIVKKLLSDDGSINAEEKRPAAGIIHKCPNVWQTANYIRKSIMLHADLFIERKILRKDQRWAIAYSRRFWTAAALSEGKRIPNPRYRFLADPFVIRKDGKHYIFVEDYDFRTGLGSVSCVVVSPDDTYEFIDHVLAEPFHLSFPFVFEASGETFMLPETHKSNDIRLYRCVEFPDKWELDTELLRGVSAADTMLIKRHDKWFMLTNMNQFSSDDHLSQLHVFWSNDLHSSQWKPLSSLPVVNSPRIGRNGGLLPGRNGDWFRVRQRQAFNQYGAGFSIAKITQLDLDGYSEELFAEIDPLFFDHLKGTHHMHGVEDFTVYDFVTVERYS
jgi:hypothetical protein